MVAIWQWWVQGPPPSSACPPRAEETEISGMKLMRTSDGGSASSSSRLSSLWVPQTLKTVQSSCLLKGVHRWLNTPRWPDQLFYYSRRGPLWTRWQKHIFSLKIKRESAALRGFNACWLCKNLGRRLWLESEQGRLWSCGRGCCLPKVTLQIHIPPLIFLSVKAFCSLRLLRLSRWCSSEPENWEHVFHLSAHGNTIITLCYHVCISH